MKERESLYPNFDTGDIISGASAKIKEGRFAMSKKVAVALVIQDLGRNMLDGLISGPKMRLRSPEEIDSMMGYGIGAIAFGGIIFALEQGAAVGWHAEVLRESVRESTLGLNIGTWEEEDFVVGVDPNEEARKIKEVLSGDNTFVSFFEPNIDKLPKDLRIFLDENPNLLSDVKSVLPVYKQAIHSF